MKKQIFSKNFIGFIICLLVIETFLEWLSHLLGWNWLVRDILLLIGFFGDLFFSCEFIFKFIKALRLRKFKKYFFYEQGYLDFFSSLPVIICDSFPWMIKIFLNYSFIPHYPAIGLLSLLKLVQLNKYFNFLNYGKKVKIFRKVKNPQSPMAMHYTSKFLALVLIVMVFGSSVASFCFQKYLNKSIQIRKQYYQQKIDNIVILSSKTNIDKKILALPLFKDDKNILEIRYNNAEFIKRITDHEFYAHYASSEYLVAKNDLFEMKISLVDLNARLYLFQLFCLFLILIVYFNFSLFVNNIFAKNITDSLQIMIYGFKQKDFKQKVEYNSEQKNEEVFILAKFYNDSYLPAKLKRNNEKNR